MRKIYTHLRMSARKFSFENLISHWNILIDLNGYKKIVSSETWEICHQKFSFVYEDDITFYDRVFMSGTNDFVIAVRKLNMTNLWVVRVSQKLIIIFQKSMKLCENVGDWAFEWQLKWLKLTMRSVKKFWTLTRTWPWTAKV